MTKNKLFVTVFNRRKKIRKKTKVDQRNFDRIVRITLLATYRVTHRSHKRIIDTVK